MIYDERLTRYVELLLEHAPRLGLISRADLGRVRERHIHDSLRVLPLLRSLPRGRCVDVGSGAGLPGVPLAIAARDHFWRFIEPRRKRAAFLEEVVRECRLQAEVVPLRAEVAAADPALAGGHALAIARALAPPADAFSMLLPFVGESGVACVIHSRTARLPPKAEPWRPGIAIIRR